LEANNGLADLGDVLPAGVEIVLPELSLPETDEVIRLWD
jgi:phage tail protein X